jgi:hypothetical protein
MTGEGEVSACKSVVKLFRGFNATIGDSCGELVEMFGRVFQPSLVCGVMAPRFEFHQRRASPDLRGCVSTVAVRKIPASHVEMMLGLVD